MGNILTNPPLLAYSSLVSLTAAASSALRPSRPPPVGFLCVHVRGGREGGERMRSDSPTHADATSVLTTLEEALAGLDGFLSSPV